MLLKKNGFAIVRSITKYLQQTFLLICYFELLLGAIALSGQITRQKTIDRTIVYICGIKCHQKRLVQMLMVKKSQIFWKLN